MKTIVVAYDGSRPSEQALRRAVEQAEAFGARLVVATVEPAYPPTEVAIYMGEGGFGLPLIVPPGELGDANGDRWEQHLARARAYVESRGVAYELVAPVGRPAQEIVEIAAQYGAELIVVGTHEPGVLRRLFRGSVSEGVARKAHCDVLVVHPGPEPD